MLKWLYQRRLLELEREFRTARRKIAELERELAGKPEEVDKVWVKMRLDLITGMIRLLKEQTAYYLRLRDSFDLARMYEDLVEEIHRTDPILCLDLIERLDNRWRSSGPKSAGVPPDLTNE